MGWLRRRGCSTLRICACGGIFFFCFFFSFFFLFFGEDEDEDQDDEEGNDSNSNNCRSPSRPAAQFRPWVPSQPRAGHEDDVHCTLYRACPTCKPPFMDLF